MVKPGVTGVLVTAGHAADMPRCLPVLKMIAPEMNRDAIGVNRDAIRTNCGTPCLSRYSLSVIIICPGIATVFYSF